MSKQGLLNLDRCSEIVQQRAVRGVRCANRSASLRHADRPRRDASSAGCPPTVVRRCGHRTRAHRQTCLRTVIGEPEAHKRLRVRAARFSGWPCSSGCRTHPCSRFPRSPRCPIGCERFVQLALERWNLLTQLLGCYFGLQSVELFLETLKLLLISFVLGFVVLLFVLDR